MMTSSSSSPDDPENPNDIETDSAGRTMPYAMAGEPQRPGQPAGGVSPEDPGVHAELDGNGKRTSQPGASGELDSSTQPANATRELNTSDGALPYRTIAERLAVNIARWLDGLLENAQDDIHITPEWIRDVHRYIAGELFPEWAGRFRTIDVHVGTHMPPPAFEVAVQVGNFCLDLEERIRHLSGVESIATLLAWVDWRFQWIHPFKDFNGRMGRILLVALCYKLGLPPVDPTAVDDSMKAAYFDALRAADAGDLSQLTDLWLERLSM
jgi:fido (protein-threonine AMPylation protein)